MKKLLIVLLIIATLIIPQIGCNAQAQNNNTGISKTSFHLDTVCTITIYSMEGIQEMSRDEQERETLSLITEAFKVCDDYEKILSKTIEGSDVYRINHASGQWVEVSEDTVAVVEQGLSTANLVGGVFDITIGEVTQLWDFRSEDEEGNRIGTLPDEKELAEAISHVDYKKVEIEGNRVRLLDSHAQLDLGGVAKGYIADRVAEYIEERGVVSGIIDLGGNIVVIGQKGESLDDYGEATDFSVGIASPLSERGDLFGTVSCADKTVVTSGTYERYFEIEGVKYHHVLDSQTGYPAETDLLSVTVLSDKGNSALCDALSTAALALGKEKALDMLEAYTPVSAILVDTEGEVTFVRTEFN